MNKAQKWRSEYDPLSNNEMMDDGEEVDGDEKLVGDKSCHENYECIKREKQKSIATKENVGELGRRCLAIKSLYICMCVCENGTTGVTAQRREGTGKEGRRH